MNLFLIFTKRTWALLLDSLLFEIIGLMFLIPVMRTDGSFWFYLSLLGFSSALCKDTIDGRSPFKRIFDFQVVDLRTGEVASHLQCLIRNLTFLLMPIEFIIVLANDTNRRIGDRIAGTKVVRYDPLIFHKTNHSTYQLILSFVLSYSIVYLISVALKF